MRLPDRPTRTHAWRWARRAPRSLPSDDQCPSPKRAVRAPAVAFCSAAIAGTSSGVASRNVRRTRSTAGAPVRCPPLREPPILQLVLVQPEQVSHLVLEGEAHLARQLL